MGRLTLNVLLSFAQFEREVIGERIRDKIAASRKRGMWMGGYCPMGYAAKDRKLVIREDEAALVRSIFRRFAKGGSGTKLVRELALDNVRNRYGKLVTKGALYKMLNNRTYIGEVVHKGTVYPGEHTGIIDRELWDKVHAILKESPRKRAGRNRAQTPALLKGLIYGPNCVPMTPTHTRKNGKLYRYYIATTALRSGIPDNNPIRRIPASEIEAAVIDQIQRMVRSPEIVVATWRAAKVSIKGLTEAQVRDHLHSFIELWNELFPAEQARIVQLLVARVDVGPTGADITLRTDGLASLMQDLRASTDRQEKAA
jgi:hypothetical protein